MSRLGETAHTRPKEGDIMRRIQKRTVVLTVIAGLATAGAGFVTLKGRTSDNTQSERVQRGEYLVKIMGCNDCHTPWKMGPKGPEPDMTRFLSGHPEEIGVLPARTGEGPWLWSGAPDNTAFSGPWGVSYTMNLTPDVNTGIGIWTEDMFV